jgi:cardiolipin synthase
MWLAILATLLVTLFLTVVILNLRAGEKQIRYELTHLFAVEDPQFLRTMGQLLGPAVVSNNSVKALHNGDEIFPAMLAAIASAEKTITFETYIYWSGEVGRKFSKALSDRARAGVKVHVMLDWVGAARSTASTWRI